jgi:hypothetical protein
MIAFSSVPNPCRKADKGKGREVSSMDGKDGRRLSFFESTTDFCSFPDPIRIELRVVILRRVRHSETHSF